MASTRPNGTSVTLQLAYPVEYQGAVIQELTIRRPKGKDMRFLPKGEAGVDEMYPFFALLMNVDEGVIDEMDAADLTKIGDVITDFLSTKKGSRPTLVRGGK